MSDDERREVRQFQPGADDFELFARSVNASRLRPNMVLLAKRLENGDSNVIPIKEEDGTVRYKLEFTDDQRARLEKGYMECHPDGAKARREAEIFVDLLESWAESVVDFQAAEPPDQKTRKRMIAPTIKAIENLDQALSALDTAALGWIYAHVVDALALEGVQVSDADGRIVSMRDESYRAQVEGRERQQEIRRIVEAVVPALKSAAETLPIAARTENDWRLQNALGVLRQLRSGGIPIDTTENGYAAEALRALFALAGEDIDSVGYWLKKAAEKPGHTPWA